MKKIVLSFACFITLLFSSLDSYALKIFGVEIHYVRGKKEWNANHTATECVGRGMCELTISGSGGVGAKVGNVDGTLVIAIPASYYAQYPEDFENNEFDVNFNFEISQADATSISYTGPLSFPEGTYNVQYDSEEDEYFVFLQ